MKKFNPKFSVRLVSMPTIYPIDRSLEKHGIGGWERSLLR